VPHEGVRAPEGAGGADRFTIETIGREGVLDSALWAHPVATTGDATGDAIARGREVFRLSCSACHTMDGYLVGALRIVGWMVAVFLRSAPAKETVAPAA